MELTVLGGSPATENPGGACAGYLISEGDTRILVDCGHGVVGVLASVTNIADLSAVVISHMHPDHYFDMVPLSYAFRFQRIPPIPLYLPPGGRETLEQLQPICDLSETFFADTYRLQTYDPEGQVEVSGFRITFAPTRHFIPAWAMSFTGLADGRALAYSSDTGWSENVKELMNGVSLALVEATTPRYPNPHQAEGHMSAEDAGRMAREAGAERLVVTHSWYANQDETLRLASEAFGQPVALAREGATFTV